MSKTIWLIAESRKDEAIFKQLLQAKQISVRVHLLRVEIKTGGLSRLAKQLEKLILQARDFSSPGDCIAVLHDADEKTQSDRSNYMQIEQICNQYPGVYLLIARDEIESWLLADEAICKWLGAKPRNCDEELKPSDVLASLFQKKHNRKLQGRDRDELLKRLNGTGDKHSPSMKKAFQLLRECLGLT